MWERRKLKPESPEQAHEAETIQGKRKRLFRHQHEHPLVREIFMSAQYQGLSGEDTMTWLAYEALLRVEQLEELILDDSMLRIKQPLILNSVSVENKPEPDQSGK